MHRARGIAGGLRPPPFFRQTDSVFAGDDAAPGQYLCEELIEGLLHSFSNIGIPVVPISHDVDVNVAVTRMAETGDRETGPLRQSFSELNQVDQTASRDHNVLVQ